MLTSCQLVIRDNNATGVVLAKVRVVTLNFGGDNTNEVLRCMRYLLASAWQASNVQTVVSPANDYSSNSVERSSGFATSMRTCLYIGWLLKEEVGFMEGKHWICAREHPGCQYQAEWSPSNIH